MQWLKSLNDVCYVITYIHSNIVLVGGVCAINHMYMYVYKYVYDCSLHMMMGCFAFRAVDLFLSDWIWCAVCPLRIWWFFLGRRDVCPNYDLCSIRWRRFFILSLRAKFCIWCAVCGCACGDLRVPKKWNIAEKSERKLKKANGLVTMWRST